MIKTGETFFIILTPSLTLSDNTVTAAFGAIGIRPYKRVREWEFNYHSCFQRLLEYYLRALPTGS
jgi:hypothetical protein